MPNQGLVLTFVAGWLYGRSIALVWMAASISSAAACTALALALPAIGRTHSTWTVALAQLCIWLTRQLPCWDDIPLLRRVNTLVELCYLLPGASLGTASICRITVVSVVSRIKAST